MKYIVVPKNKAAQHALDYNEASDDQLFQIALTAPQFHILWQSGIFQQINSIANIKIDDFEDDAVTDIPAIKQILASPAFTSEFDNSEMNQLLASIKSLLEKAITCNTGIFFYF